MCFGGIYMVLHAVYTAVAVVKTIQVSFFFLFLKTGSNFSKKDR